MHGTVTGLSWSTKARAALVVAAALYAPRAEAQTASNQAAAEALFDQGKAAMAAKNYAEACPKFFESNRLDEGIGTSLWLADCYEQNGQTASAWAQFREAAALAVKASDPREKVARERAQALDRRLARLVILVPAGSRLPGLRVARDGGEVSRTLWGTSLPADPGRHTVVVSAPDHRPRTLTIDILPGPGEQALLVPPLDPGPTPPPVVVAGEGSSAPEGPKTPAGPASFPRRRVAAIAAAGAGVVMVGLGSYFGLHASSLLNDSNAGPCNAKDQCNGAGLAERSSAESAATVSTALFIVGGAVIAGGAFLWFTTPARPAPSGALASPARTAWQPSIVPWVGPTGAGVVLNREF